MKKNQMTALLLTTTMALNGIIVPTFGSVNDVSGHWAQSVISKWQNEGRVGGYQNGTFLPDRAITRAEFIRLLNNTATTTFTSNTQMHFSDVKQQDWYYNDIAKAVSGNVTKGFEDGTFRPNETITRAQAAVLICNAKGLTPNEYGADRFTDVSQIPNWARGAVGAAVSAGYLSGYPDGTFYPNKGMTRAEAVSTLDRVLTNAPQKQTTAPTQQSEQSENAEEIKTANSGQMVWKSGGSGGGGSKSNSSSTSDDKYNNVVIRSQAQADYYSGETVTGTTKIYITNEGIDLTNIKFDGDVDIYAKSDVAVGAAYAEGDTAVAAAYLFDIDVVFEGTTGVTGRIRVISNDYVNTQVVIRTRVPKKVSKFIAIVAAKIVGFDIETVESQAPIVVSEGTSVGKVEAKDGSSVTVEENADIENIVASGEVSDITLNGNSSTNVTITNGTSVDNITVNDTASAGVTVENGANVEKITLNDNAKADIDVKQNATVDTIDSNSSATGTTITGTGNIDTITANNPGTINKEEEVETPITPTKPDTPNKPTTPSKPSTPVTKVTVTAKNGVTNGKAKPGSSPVFEATGIDGTINWSAKDADDKAYTISNGTLTIPADTADGTVITVTATSADDEKLTASTTVTVEAPKTQSITLSKTSATLAIGNEVEITATAKDQYNEDVAVTWEIKDGDGNDYAGEAGKVTIANVTDGKKITNAGADTAMALTVKATTADGKEATATVEITTETATVEKVVISPKTAVLTAGSATKTQQFTAEAQSADGTNVIGKTITFDIDADAKTAGSSIANGVLTIGDYDTLTKGQTASITVTADCEGKKDTATVTVNAPAQPDSIEITAPTDTTITAIAGDATGITFTARILDQYGNEMTAEKSNIVWTMLGAQQTGTIIHPKTGKLVVDENEPKGTLYITAMYNYNTNIIATKEVTVKPKPAEIKSIELITDVSEKVNLRTATEPVIVELTAVIKDVNGNIIEESDREVIWRINKATTSTILESGTKFIGEEEEETEERRQAITKTNEKGEAKGKLSISPNQRGNMVFYVRSKENETIFDEFELKITPKGLKPTATVDNKTITATVGTPMPETTISVILGTSEGGSPDFRPMFRADKFDVPQDVSNWIKNLPEGLHATIKDAPNNISTSIYITGTPTEPSTEALKIVIPPNLINGDHFISEFFDIDETVPIYVTENVNTKFNIENDTSNASIVSDDIDDAVNEVIESVSISGITTPAYGDDIEIPDLTTEEDTYDVEAVWKYDTDEEDSGIFEEKTYTLEITLTPKYGYVFSDDIEELITDSSETATKVTAEHGNLIFTIDFTVTQ